MRISIKGDAGVQFQVMRMWLEIGRAGCKTNYRKAKNDGSAKYGMVKWTRIQKNDRFVPDGYVLQHFHLSYWLHLTSSGHRFTRFWSWHEGIKEFKQISNPVHWPFSGLTMGFDSARSGRAENVWIPDDGWCAITHLHHIAYSLSWCCHRDLWCEIYLLGNKAGWYDSTYKPLINATISGYPSGHATGAATTAAVLQYFFPADAKQFQQLAQDCADSRFDAGIHFRTDNETGLRMGAAIGKYITETWMKK